MEPPIFIITVCTLNEDTKTTKKGMNRRHQVQEKEHVQQEQEEEEEEKRGREGSAMGRVRLEGAEKYAILKLDE